MDKNQSVKDLCLHALEVLHNKVENISPIDENYAVLRNTQKTAEALMETVLNEGSTEDSYFSSDFGWKAGDWPLEATLQTGEKIVRSRETYTNDTDSELASVFYRGNGGREIEIFND
jgi:hypothetical protein